MMCWASKSFLSPVGLGICAAAFAIRRSEWLLLLGFLVVECRSSYFVLGSHPVEGLGCEIISGGSVAEMLCQGRIQPGPSMCHLDIDTSVNVFSFFRELFSARFPRSNSPFSGTRPRPTGGEDLRIVLRRKSRSP